MDHTKEQATTFMSPEVKSEEQIERPDPSASPTDPIEGRMMISDECSSRRRHHPQPHLEHDAPTSHQSLAVEEEEFREILKPSTLPPPPRYSRKRYPSSRTVKVQSREIDTPTSPTAPERRRHSYPRNSPNSHPKGMVKEDPTTIRDGPKHHPSSRTVDEELREMVMPSSLLAPERRRNSYPRNSPNGYPKRTVEEDPPARDGRERHPSSRATGDELREIIKPSSLPPLPRGRGRNRHPSSRTVDEELREIVTPSSPPLLECRRHSYPRNIPNSHPKRTVEEDPPDRDGRERHPSSRAAEDELREIVKPSSLPPLPRDSRNRHPSSRTVEEEVREIVVPSSPPPPRDSRNRHPTLRTMEEELLEIVTPSSLPAPERRRHSYRPTRKSPNRQPNITVEEDPPTRDGHKRHPSSRTAEEELREKVKRSSLSAPEYLRNSPKGHPKITVEEREKLRQLLLAAPPLIVAPQTQAKSPAAATKDPQLHYHHHHNTTPGPSSSNPTNHLVAGRQHHRHRSPDVFLSPEYHHRQSPPTTISPINKRPLEEELYARALELETFDMVKQSSVASGALPDRARARTEFLEFDTVKPSSIAAPLPRRHSSRTMNRSSKSHQKRTKEEELRAHELLKFDIVRPSSSIAAPRTPVAQHTKTPHHKIPQKRTLMQELRARELLEFDILPAPPFLEKENKEEPAAMPTEENHFRGSFLIYLREGWQRGS
jgi:hypothetical protein